ncbi:MAG: hypothetical protein CFE24_06175 [Flavobacterium sp. BFFFF2]|nr:MAG: hypothetical protein CFE24_06175 [Flavobacterium sp. BFFFF2]
MNANNNQSEVNEAQKEAETLKNVCAFFETKIGLNDFAKQLRRANFLLAETAILLAQNDLHANTDWTLDCLFHLNDFAEVLDPYLSVEP